MRLERKISRSKSPLAASKAAEKDKKEIRIQVHAFLNKFMDVFAVKNASKGGFLINIFKIRSFSSLISLNFSLILTAGFIYFRSEEEFVTRCK